MYKLFIAVIALCSSLSGYAQPAFYNATTQLPASAIAGNTMDLKVADLNGDSYPDIVLAKEWQRNRILFNDGTGHFTDVTEGRFANVGHDSEDIAIADLDGNSWSDVVFACEDDTTHEMYLNTGAGNFDDVSDRLPHFVSNAVVAVDINGDTFIDLLFGNNGQDRIFINDGTAHFTDETSTRMPVSDDITQDVLLIDVDHDDDWDLVMGNEDGNKLLINDGTGIFTDETSLRMATTVNMETRKVSKADVNGDGYDDLFFCNMASAAGRDIRDRLYLNDGTGHFTDVTLTALPDDARHTFDAVFNDFNGDAKPDILVGYMGNQPPAILINNGSGVFTEQSQDYLPAGISGNHIAVLMHDLNNDGKADIYLGRFQQQDALLLAGSVSGIEEHRATEMLSIYPNPADKKVTIRMNKPCAGNGATLVLRDIAGKEIRRQYVGMKKEIVFSTASLPSGVYQVSLQSDKCSVSRKLIIQS